MNDEWDDVQILDENVMFDIAKEFIHSAFMARKVGGGDAVSSLVTKALNALNDCEQVCPDRLYVLRNSLENI